MMVRSLPLSRRTLIAGLAGTALAAGFGFPATRTQTRTVALRLQPGTRPLRDNQPPSPTWAFVDGIEPLILPQGEFELALTNDLPIPVAADIRGLLGAAAHEPLLARPPTAPGATTKLNLSLRQAGTLLLDTRLLGDAGARALPVRPLIAREAVPVAADRDQVLLIEDWRLAADGTATAPGRDPAATPVLFTINGRPSLDLAVAQNERLRFRIINGCQRAVIALKIDNHDVRVMAIDGQPAEPFIARNSQVVLAPGTRIDAVVDMTGAPSGIFAIQLHDGTAPRPLARLVYGDKPRPLTAPLLATEPFPSNGLPEKLDLRNALRVDLPLDVRTSTEAAGWASPASFSATRAPVFRTKRGRVVVLALINRTSSAVMFRLHGGPFRLLDRLDDGWKPFWLDTLILDAQQTHRIAFAATPGAWLLETAGTDWSAPRLVQWYAVD
ncbi:multicopper oxidase family protein [Bradyrhizobium sp. 2TAF24]|uniref:multicopper oxidase family protein n=1 Tax=Bradyrhizobium sp. 2TAF24 TaxID=3233011 RepID=UPI003F8F2E90